GEVRTIDANGQPTELAYDALGRLRFRTDSDGVTEWVYDGDGETDVPNALGRLVETIRPPVGPNGRIHRVRYAYEPVAAPNRGLLQSKTYDLDGRELTIGFEYDAKGRMEILHYPGQAGAAGPTIKYEHNAFGYMTRVLNVTGGATDSLWSIDEVEKGFRPKKETFADGSSTTYGYTMGGRIRTLRNQTAQGLLRQNLEYVYYGSTVNAVNAGQLSHKFDHTKSPHPQEYIYDPLNRIREVRQQQPDGSISTSRFTYDAIGNQIGRA